MKGVHGPGVHVLYFPGKYSVHRKMQILGEKKIRAQLWGTKYLSMLPALTCVLRLPD